MCDPWVARVVARLDPWIVHNRLLLDEYEREAVFADIAAEMGLDMAKDSEDIAEQRRLMEERAKAVAEEQRRISEQRAKEAAEAAERERRARGN